MDGNRLKIMMFIGLLVAGACGLYLLKQFLLLMRSSARLALLVLTVAGVAAAIWWSQRLTPMSKSSAPIYQSQ